MYLFISAFVIGINIEVHLIQIQITVLYFCAYHMFISFQGGMSLCVCDGFDNALILDVTSYQRSSIVYCGVSFNLSTFTYLVVKMYRLNNSSPLNLVVSFLV